MNNDSDTSSSSLFDNTTEFSFENAPESVVKLRFSDCSNGDRFDKLLLFVEAAKVGPLYFTMIECDRDIVARSDEPTYSDDAIAANVVYSPK